MLAHYSKANLVNIISKKKLKTQQMSRLTSDK